jgi:nuclear receptor subfamily 1 group F member 4
VKDTMVIQRLNDIIDAALRHQLRQTHTATAGASGADLHARVFEKLATLQLISSHHSDLLMAFKAAHPDIEFPALHKELFSQEGIDSSQ